MQTIDTERLRKLANFIRNQANLTDTQPPQIGPGEVRLNYEEAMLAADALDAELRYREALATASDENRELLAFAENEWMDASEAVAMGGGTGSRAHEVYAASPQLRRMCTTVDRWQAIVAMIREKIEQPV